MSQQPCLPLSTKRKRIDNGTIVVDFDDIPSASEYLQRVVQQARGIADDTLIAASTTNTTTVTRTVSSSSSLQHVNGSAAASLQYLLSSHTQVVTPTTIPRQPHEGTWITHTLQQFKILRTYLTTCQQTGIGGKEHRLTAVPPMKDATGWIEFCTGHVVENDESNNNNDNNNNNNDNTVTPAWRLSLPPAGYHVPTVHLLCQMDQVMIRRVLAHLAVAISNERSMQWMYALLARLETPLHRDDAATLRRIVVTVAAQRAAASDNNNNNNMAAMNLVLVVAGLYFGQAKYEELFPSL